MHFSPRNPHTGSEIGGPSPIHFTSCINFNSCNHQAHKKGSNQSQLHHGHFLQTKVSIKHVVSKLFKIVYEHASAVMRIDRRETRVAISQRNTALRVSGALN